MAHVLDMKVIDEDVETEEQRDLLLKAGRLLLRLSVLETGDSRGVREIVLTDKSWTVQPAFL